MEGEADAITLSFISETACRPRLLNVIVALSFSSFSVDCGCFPKRIVASFFGPCHMPFLPRWKASLLFLSFAAR